jgi:hypothetical protein
MRSDVEAPVKGYEELSRQLWRQRHLLETLLFKLEVERLLLAAGDTRWIDRATQEVATVIEQIRGEELARVTSPVIHLTTAAGLPPDASISDVIGVAPAPWDDILRDHQAMLLTAIAEVEEAAASNRDLLRRALRRTQDFLSSLGAPLEPEGYSRTGSTTSGETRPTIFDSDA